MKKLAYIWSRDYVPQAVLASGLFLAGIAASAASQALGGLFFIAGISLFAGVLAMALGGRTRLGIRRDYWRSTYAAKSGRMQEALEHATRQTDRRPNDARGWEARALALYGSVRLEEALACADRSLEIERSWRGYMIRGLVLAALGAGNGAAADFKESLRYWRHSHVEIALARISVAERRLNEALRILARANRRGRKWSIGLLAVADVHRLLGNTEEVQRRFRLALKRADREIAAGMPAHSVRAYCLAQLNREAEAVKAAGAALELAGRDPFALLVKMLLNVRSGEHDLAEETLRKMLFVSPSSVVGTLTDPQFTPLLTEGRFRNLLAWALGAQRDILERLRVRFPHLFPA